MLLISNIIIPGTTTGDNPGSDEDSTPIESTDSDETESDLFASITQTLQIDPGESFYIYFDPGDDELSAKPPVDLPPTCDQALAMVPRWLRGNLSFKFRQLSSEFQNTYANLILNSPDEKYIDEIAFVIAHTAVENLQDDYFFPELITHNAQLIYDADQYLKYVEIVERDDYTTVIYKDRDNVSCELPKGIYYWYIVEPKLSDELATYVDPEYNYTTDPPFDKNYGVPPPTGKFWRDWLFYFNDSGYPLLKEKLEGAYTLWEAISRCNSWISGSMRFTSDITERPIQPVRIYRKHYGRCGEYQDMRNAIARAGLIPSTCTLNTAEDHVWNEFWDKRWIHWDGAVDNPMMYENGWGKKISSVWNTRGDSDIWSVSKKYTKICNYTATVLDDSGMPVDGALVRVSTEYYYNPDLLTTTTWGSTDYTGNVTIPLGDERNFWSSAESDDLGSDPINGVTQVISNSEADASYTYTFHLPLSAPRLDYEEITPPGIVDPHFEMEVKYDVEAHITQVENVYTGEHGDSYGQSGNIDFFIADLLNYNLYANDLSFDAYNVEERSISNDVLFTLPNEDRYYAVFSNEFSQSTTKIINITVNIYSSLKLVLEKPLEGEEFFHGDIFIIEGTAWGPEGVDKVEIDIDDMNNWMPALDTSEEWEEPFTTWELSLDTSVFKPGIHMVKAKASDNENISMMQKNFSLLDATDPVLNIESPSEGDSFWLGDALTVNGTATDNGWIESVKLIIDSDEQNFTDITSYLSDDHFSYEMDVDDIGYGDHTITVIISDTAQNNASDTKAISVFEEVSPEVRIQNPTDSQIFRPGETIDIAGIATDNEEIASLELIFDNNDTVNIISNLLEDGTWTYRWNAPSSSSEGEHKIEVWATDGSGNKASDMTTVSLDGINPELLVESPLEGAIYWLGDTIIVSGTATDNIMVDTLEMIIDSDEVNRTDITYYLVDESWSIKINTHDLDYGEHTITIRVIDEVLNLAYITRNIRILEKTTPVVRIDDPSDEDVFKQGNTIYFSGFAQDNKEIASLEIVIDSTIQIDITSNIMQDGFWSYNWETQYTTSEGEHDVEVIATDGSGNVASDRIKIILDGTSPSTEIAVSEENQVFKAGSPIEFYGTAFDNLGITNAYLIIDDETVIDITWKISDGDWNYKLWETRELESGTHTITISVQDQVGHIEEASTTFEVDSQDPKVEIAAYEESEVVGGSISIIGNAFDDTGIKEMALIIDNEEPINITSVLINGNWEYDLETFGLSEGKHTIIVIVTDNVDNQAMYSVKIKLVEDTTDTDSPIDGSSGEGDKDSEGFSEVDAFILLLITIVIFAIIALVAFFKWPRKEK
ncbi:MAG: hypothetical protein JSW00_18570 [Thermoplasmata archaeon]|nr:MAG: hypothetical protein JSW00_18570 [Thermoplasmata archaeon]